jgi:hypothetical protein
MCCCCRLKSWIWTGTLHDRCCWYVDVWIDELRGGCRYQFLWYPPLMPDFRFVVSFTTKQNHTGKKCHIGNFWVGQNLICKRWQTCKYMQIWLKICSKRDKWQRGEGSKFFRLCDKVCQTKIGCDKVWQKGHKLVNGHYGSACNMTLHW